MSGTGGARSDSDHGSSGGDDPCAKIRRGPINSPKADVIGKLKVGSALDVKVETVGSRPVLVVATKEGERAGSLTFVGYLEILDCIQNRGVTYRATVTSLASGICEVRVEPSNA